MAETSGGTVRAVGIAKRHCSACNNGDRIVFNSAVVNGFVVNNAIEEERSAALPGEGHESTRMTQDAGSAESLRMSFLQFGRAKISNFDIERARHQAAFGNDQTSSGNGIGTLMRLSSESNSIACFNRPDSLFSGFRITVSNQGSS